MNQQICANTLLFEKDWRAGRSQAGLVLEAAELGFQTVEVRREYFRDLATELAELRQIAADKQLSLFYSVPEFLFVAGQVNPALPTYLAEARELGAQRVKLVLGDFAAFTGDLRTALLPFVGQGFGLNVENDQSAENGRIEPLKAFLLAARAAEVEVKLTFDVGNWVFAGENPLQAARELADFVRDVHVKDVAQRSLEPVVVALDAGALPWQKVLHELPKNRPVALEFAAENQEIVLQNMAKLAACLAGQG